MVWHFRQRIALLSVLLAAPFFFKGGPSYYSARFFHSLWDLGHILFFALASWLILSFLQGRERRAIGFLALFLRVFSLVLLIGIGIELLQMLFTHRQPDLFDVFRNQLGCLLALAFFHPDRTEGDRRTLRWLRVVALFLLASALWPFLRDLCDEVTARCQYPLLADFETPFEKGRWVDERQLSVQDKIVRHGEKALKVRLSTATYSGTSLLYFPHDWRGYKWFHCSVYNPKPLPLTLYCRIHDRLHRALKQPYKDRFHQKFVLHAGWNDLKISLAEVQHAPAGREMEMDRIEQVGFFVVRQPAPSVLYIDSVYLGQ